MHCCICVILLESPCLTTTGTIVHKKYKETISSTTPPTQTKKDEENPHEWTYFDDAPGLPNTGLPHVAGDAGVPAKNLYNWRIPHMHHSFFVLVQWTNTIGQGRTGRQKLCTTIGFTAPFIPFIALERSNRWAPSLHVMHVTQNTPSLLAPVPMPHLHTSQCNRCLHHATCHTGQYTKQATL